MAECTYSAVDKSGKRITGTLTALGRDDVANQLAEQDLIVTKIVCSLEKPKEEKQSALSSKIKLIPDRISSEDLMIFTRQIATMVGAGLTLVQALYSLAEDIDNQKMKKVITDIGSKILGGMSFSEALKTHPDVFNKMYVNLVKVGEIGGNLEKILRSLAEYIESSEALKKKVISALYYPVTVMTFAFLIVSGLFLFIIPRFAEIYKGFGAALPGPTLIFLNFAEFFKSFYWLIFLVLVGGVWFFTRSIKTPTGSMWFDRLKLSMPLIGPLVQKIVIARFAKTLALLYQSGVPIIESMSMVASSCGNSVVEKAILTASEQVLDGENIAGTLDKSKIFPVMVINMIDVGERTGNLSDMLNKVSEYYETQVNATINGLTSLLEPIMVINMGIIIGLIAVCLFLPIVKLPTVIMT
ncbi:MAG: type II secretion system F family protein [Firmicutes bacterium]|nr:type II secretion system F family protein [Bacillota bacterium]